MRYLLINFHYLWKIFKVDIDIYYISKYLSVKKSDYVGIKNILYIRMVYLYQLEIRKKGYSQ